MPNGKKVCNAYVLMATGVMITEKCRPIFAVVAFYTWKCKEECTSSLIGRIVCPKPLTIRFYGKMSCTCIYRTAEE
uniref:Uncharacterized protein n=1 Tax=Romanomermis culicivorax TaxID=13658 RepID=A0A915LB38_ROMCU